MNEIGRERKLKKKLEVLFSESYAFRTIMDSYARAGKDEKVREYADKYMKLGRIFWRLAKKTYKLDTLKYNYIVDYEKACIVAVSHIIKNT